MSATLLLCCRPASLRLPTKASFFAQATCTAISGCTTLAQRHDAVPMDLTTLYLAQDEKITKVQDATGNIAKELAEFKMKQDQILHEIRLQGQRSALKSDVQELKAEARELRTELKAEVKELRTVAQVIMGLAALGATLWRIPYIAAWFS